MYDFDTVINREGFGSCKWERRNDYEKSHGIMPMSIADMEFSVAACVKEAVIAAAEHGIYGYTDPTPRFLDAIRGWMKKRHSLDISRDEIITLSGVVPALRVAIRALTSPGDGVIINSPIYPPFFDSITLTGRRVEDCPLLFDGEKYEIDFEAVAAVAAKPDVTLMIICSPHNPVGRVWTVDELRKLEDICSVNGVTVVSDEIHADLVLKGRHTPYLNISSDCVLLAAPSKTFNIPGLNTAFCLVRNPALRERMAKQVKIDGFENMSYFGHVAAIAAYEGAADWLDAALDYIRGNFETLAAFIKDKMPMLKLIDAEGTYLAWIDFRPLGYNERDLETFTREKAHLILDEGYIFGKAGSGFERINLAVPRQELVKALDRL
ncbi:MAG: MalY/PatB family protein, partial [Clostridia bacterium]|nr:MalY/PatB family protein [Clostridia bacterium]